MTVAPPAPILLSRTAYLAMLLAAEKAAKDPGELPILLEVIKVLEAERDLREWDATDVETLAAVRQGQDGVVGDERGYYLLHARGQAMPEPGEALRRTLWQGEAGEAAIVVVDQPPIAAERIHRLLHKGALRPTEVRGLKGSPFRAFAARRRNNVDKPGWSRVGGSAPETGAWLHSGTGQAVAWVPLADDARYLADCVNAVMRLGQDIARSIPPRPGISRVSGTHWAGWTGALPGGRAGAAGAFRGRRVVRAARRGGADRSGPAPVAGGYRDLPSKAARPGGTAKPRDAALERFHADWNRGPRLSLRAEGEAISIQVRTLRGIASLRSQ